MRKRLGFVPSLSDPREPDHHPPFFFFFSPHNYEAAGGESVRYKQVFPTVKRETLPNTIYNSRFFITRCATTWHLYEYHFHLANTHKCICVLWTLL